MKSFRLHRPVKDEPETRGHQKRRRWRVLAGGLLGIFVSVFLGWKLLTDSRGTDGARIAGWVLLPLFVGICVWVVVLSIKKKEGDPFYADIEKNSD